MKQPTPVSAFSDNYIWLIPAKSLATPDEQVLIVDPGAAAPVLNYLQAHSLKPLGILITHHHYDHVDGIDALLQHYDMPVYGPAASAIAGIDHPLKAGDRIAPAKDLVLDVMATPGHTRDHLAYFGNGMLFCGDTLFAGGCGRLFEGTAAQLYASLQKLGRLPAATQVFCAHEYTLANLQFASILEPDNEALQQRLAATIELRQQKITTLPSTLALELATNPFLRCHVTAVHQAAEIFAKRPLSTPESVFATIRYWKDII